MARYYFLGECMISNCSAPLFTNYRVTELNPPAIVTVENRPIESYKCFKYEISAIQEVFSEFWFGLKKYMVHKREV